MQPGTGASGRPGPYTTSRHYVDRTLVLDTTFRTAYGTMIVRDAMAMGADNYGHALGRGAPHLLIRSVTGVDGAVDVDVSYQPRPEYGLLQPLLSNVEGGVIARGGAGWLVLSSPVQLEVAQSTATARFTVRAGDTIRVGM
jgi:alpha,alpha-trehalase